MVIGVEGNDGAAAGRQVSGGSLQSGAARHPYRTLWPSASAQRFVSPPPIPKPLPAPMKLRAAAEHAGPCMNLAGVDLVSIRLVVLCAESGSLSAAARRGHLSLSSASHRLTNLEGLCGTRFFERDHRGMRLTEAGAVFVSHGQAILQTLNRLSDQLTSIAAGPCSGDVRLARPTSRVLAAGA
ncbi:MAG: LysR family transcriptional regulator [Ramlibacter sp.]